MKELDIFLPKQQNKIGEVIVKVDNYLTQGE